MAATLCITILNILFFILLFAPHFQLFFIIQVLGFILLKKEHSETNQEHRVEIIVRWRTGILLGVVKYVEKQCFRQRNNFIARHDKVELNAAIFVTTIKIAVIVKVSSTLLGISSRKVDVPPYRTWHFHPAELVL